MSHRRSLRLISSQTNSDPHQKLFSVPFKTLPIVSMEEYQTRRLHARIRDLQLNRPIVYALLERWVDRLCEQNQQAHIG